MAFEDDQGNPTQEHFFLIEIDLPIITGKCEITAGNEGFGTPLSCPIQDGTSAVATKTYTFGTNNTPILPVSPIYRVITGISEIGTELKSGQGLAIRGGGSFTISDFPGDPNLERASAQAIKDQGTFLGKWQIRNVFEGREVRIKKYRISPNIDLVNDAEITFYLSKGLKSNGNGGFTLSFSDELSRVEFDQAQFPSDDPGSLRLDITDSVTAIPVDSVTDWLAKTTPYVVRIENELMTVISVSNNQTGTAALNVATRGTDIGTPQFTTFLSKTRNEVHDSGDEVFLCFSFDDASIVTVLRRILINVGMPSSIIPTADWTDEIALWHPNNKVSTIFYQSEDADKVLLSVLQVYMLDMWYDPVAREIMLKAISEWQTADATLTEGKEIDFDTLKIMDQESLRFSRAFIAFDKKFLTDPEEIGSYGRGAFSINSTLETEAFYGDPKQKRFNNSKIIDKDGADLLCVRYVQRYGLLPRRYEWTTQERFRTFNVGDVVNVLSPSAQGFDGLPANNIRAQIIQIQPVFNQVGREYRIKALTYQPASATPGENPVFTINSGVELNLFIQAGAPPQSVDVTFILNAGIFRSLSAAIPSIKAGAFAAGSTIIIILRNNADWQAKGGDGGGSETVQNGVSGGIVYDAQGIDTDIHLAGADPESGTALGTLRAPGGGGGSGRNDLTGGAEPEVIPPGGGGGGAGLDVGSGGVAFGAATFGDNGDGSTGLGGTGGLGDGTAGDGGDGGDWGQDGSNGQSTGEGPGGTGGAAGKGIVKNGATVRVFGDTPSNFINGGGDTPDP